jgi:carboxyl-terminal processing protease
MIRRHVSGLILVLVLGLALVISLGSAAEKEKVTDEATLKEYDRFIEIMRLVQKQYVRDVDTKKLFKDAIGGMLNGLDPFSNYIPEEDIDEFQKTTRGKFGGIGIQIGMRQGYLCVISPLEGTPAFEAGILAGDIIMAIDGKTAESTTLDQAVKILTGEPGTKVKLKVRHITGDIAEITITRAIIEVHTVKGVERDKNDQWIYWVDPEKKIAYIRVTSFVENSVPELKVAIDGLLKDGMKGLILDLRFNPGGILKSAVDMCDMFISEGVIVQTKGRTTPHWEATATKEGTYPFFPMVIMVNQFSASAAEIVSGCLQDHARAVIVGERSFGKGSVQNVIPLEGERAALKLTTSKYYMPSGRNIHREEDMTDKDEWGVVPDIVIPMTPEEYVAIIKARQEGEVIKRGVNGKTNGDATKPDADKSKAEPDKSKAEPDKSKAEPEKPKVEPEKVKTPDKETPSKSAPKGLKSSTPGKAGAAADAEEAGPARDKQLERAVDLLRGMEVIEKYLNKTGPVKGEPRPPVAKTEKKAA